MSSDQYGSGSKRLKVESDPTKKSFSLSGNGWTVTGTGDAADPDACCEALMRAFRNSGSEKQIVPRESGNVADGGAGGCGGESELVSRGSGTVAAGGAGMNFVTETRVANMFDAAAAGLDLRWKTGLKDYSTAVSTIVNNLQLQIDSNKAETAVVVGKAAALEAENAKLREQLAVLQSDNGILQATTAALDANAKVQTEISRLKGKREFKLHAYMSLTNPTMSEITAVQIIERQKHQRELLDLTLEILALQQQLEQNDDSLYNSSVSKELLGKVQRGFASDMYMDKDSFMKFLEILSSDEKVTVDEASNLCKEIWDTMMAAPGAPVCPRKKEVFRQNICKEMAESTMKLRSGKKKK